MSEFLYAMPSAVIAILLFVAMSVTIEASYRLGLRRRRPHDDAFSAHINAVQAALLGILALILGFTFSLALQRYDSRSEAVVDEANAIGTAYLRVDLLTPVVREEVRALMREYADVRVAEGRVTLDDHPDRERLLAEGARLQHAIWDRAVRAVELDPQEVTSGSFVQAVNAMIDAFGKRDAELGRHVPQVVLLLLFLTFLMVCTSIGYAVGIAGHRVSLVTYVMIALIVVLVFLIIDVDRPRRGFVVVSQKSMTSLQADIRSGGRSGNAPGTPPRR